MRTRWNLGRWRPALPILAALLLISCASTSSMPRQPSRAQVAALVGQRALALVLRIEEGREQLGPDLAEQVDLWAPQVRAAVAVLADASAVPDPSALELLRAARPVGLAALQAQGVPAAQAQLMLDAVGMVLDLLELVAAQNPEAAR